MILEWLRRNQTVVVPISLLVFSLGVLTYSSRQQRAGFLYRLTFSVISYGQRVASGITENVADAFHRYVWLVKVQQENEALKRENSALRRKNTQLLEQAIENDRLRRLLRFQPSEEILGWVPARVIGDDLVGFNKVIIIDKGSRDGIKPRMAVITYDSILVGQVLDEPGSVISPTSSQVVLVIDRRSRLQVMVQRPESRARGMLVGRSETNDCELLYVGQRDDVKVGDLLITSGFGRVFLKGWPVGVVRSVVHDTSSVYPHIAVQPLVDFSRLEEVIVIIHRRQEP